VKSIILRQIRNRIGVRRGETSHQKHSAHRAFTLLELMIACGITIIALAGLLSTYITCFELQETIRNSNIALNSEQAVLEEMRTAAFTSVYSSYNGYNFSLPELNNSLGLVTINNTNPQLLRIDIGVCWQQKSGRILGDCVMNAGVLTFNNTNADGIMSSPVGLTTYMAQR
jgi:type II secretory pathway pseudopilin PulG